MKDQFISLSISSFRLCLNGQMAGCCYFQYSAWCASFLYFHCYLFFYSLLPLSTLRMFIVFPALSVRNISKIKEFFFFFGPTKWEHECRSVPSVSNTDMAGVFSVRLSVLLRPHFSLSLSLSPHTHLHYDAFTQPQSSSSRPPPSYEGRYHGHIRLVEAFRGCSGLWKSKLWSYKALEILEKHKREMMLGGQTSRGQILDGKEEKGWGIMSKYESGWKWGQQRVFFCWVWGMSAPYQTIAYPLTILRNIITNEQHKPI